MSTTLHTVILNVKDMETAVHFYRDLLELPVQVSGKRWSEFAAGEVLLALHIRDAGYPDPPHSVTTLCLKVADLDATCARMRDHGHAVEGPEELEGLGALATMADPDGVTLSLSE
jgi:predicted enzyme related to lactoylglutathione lyase